MQITSRSTGHLWMSLALITCASGAMAQQGNRYGLKAGVSFNNMRGKADDASQADWRTTFHGGVFGRISAGEHLSVQAELLYSPKGTTVTYDGLINQKITFKLNYLELPVFAVIRIGDVVELHAGGYAAYLLTSNASRESDLGSDGDELDRDNFHGADYGLLLDVSANLGRVQLGLRHLHGLAELAASNNGRLVLGNAHNSTLQAYLAVALNNK